MNFFHGQGTLGLNFTPKWFRCVLLQPHDEPKVNFSVVGATSGLTWRCRREDVEGSSDISSGGGVRSTSKRTCFALKT